MSSASASLLIGAVCAFGAAQSCAQAWPSKPIRVIVPNTPGVIPDIVARIVTTELSKVLGQAIVVENKPGAGQIIGYEFVAKSAPDGYTWASTLTSELAILPLVNKNLRFNPLKDLPPAVGIAQATLVFGSATSKPWKSFDELVAHARANPGKLNYGSSSPGVLLPMLAVIQGMKLSAVNIPYNGGGPFIQAVIGGETDMGFMPESNAIAGADRFRALAVTSPQRLASFPNTPTFAELGSLKVPSNAYSFNVPAGTAEAIIDKIYTTTVAIIRQPEMKAQLAKARLTVVEETPQQASANLTERAKIYGDIARDAGIQPQ